MLTQAINSTKATAALNAYIVGLASRPRTISFNVLTLTVWPRLDSG